MNSLSSPLRTSLRCLAHPLSLACIALLLFNDHLLKVAAPSWLTGKLSDFSGLFFFPYLLVAAFGGRSPARSKNLPWLLSSLFTALIFILIKTCPPVNALAVRLLSALWHAPVQVMLDPTDLLALAVLLPSGWLWRQQTDAPLATQPARPTPRQLAALALGALAVLATSPPLIDEGLTSVCYYPEMSPVGLVARSGYATYRSIDGGITWQEQDHLTVERGKLVCSPQNFYGPVVEWSCPDNPAEIYRYDPSQGILRSQDGGQNWSLDLPLTLPSQAQQLYHQAQYPDGEFSSGPQDALCVEQTGSWLLAVGLEGLLQRSPQGEWQWLAVGPYRRVDPPGLHLLSLLSGEFWVGLWLALLAVDIMLYLIRERTRSAVWLLFSACGFAVTVLIFQTGGIPFRPIADQTLLRVFVYFLIIAGLLALIPFFTGLEDYFHSPLRLRLALLAAAVLVFLGYFLPFGLWCYGVIPLYQNAAGISLASSLVTVIAVLSWFAVLCRRLSSV